MLKRWRRSDRKCFEGVVVWEFASRDVQSRSEMLKGRRASDVTRGRDASNASRGGHATVAMEYVDWQWDVEEEKGVCLLCGDELYCVVLCCVVHVQGERGCCAELRCGQRVEGCGSV